MTSSFSLQKTPFFIPYFLYCLKTVAAGPRRRRNSSLASVIRRLIVTIVTAETSFKRSSSRVAIHLATISRVISQSGWLELNIRVATLIVKRKSRPLSETIEVKHLHPSMVGLKGLPVRLKKCTHTLCWNMTISASPCSSQSVKISGRNELTIRETDIWQV